MVSPLSIRVVTHRIEPTGKAGAHAGGVIQPVRPSLPLKRVVIRKAILIAAGWPRQLGYADHAGLQAAGEIKISVGQLFAGGDVQHH